MWNYLCKACKYNSSVIKVLTMAKIVRHKTRILFECWPTHGLSWRSDTRLDLVLKRRNQVLCDLWSFQIKLIAGGRDFFLSYAFALLTHPSIIKQYALCSMPIAWSLLMLIYDTLLNLLEFISRSFSVLCFLYFLSLYKKEKKMLIKFT